MGSRVSALVLDVLRHFVKLLSGGYQHSWNIPYVHLLLKLKEVKCYFLIGTA